MGAVEETRQLLQDFLAPEIRSIKVRLDTLEKKVDENEHRAEKRHEEVMAAIRQLTDYTALLQRVARLEARQEAQPPR
jgi:SMC interacting uncharacterized protein involved in chromosome segregation